MYITRTNASYYAYIYYLTHSQCSVINNLGDNLTVEVYRIQLLFSRKLLGLASIPLHSIRHSNRVQTIAMILHVEFVVSVLFVQLFFVYTRTCQHLLN